MSIQQVICNYIEEYFDKHHDLDNIFKFQDDLKNIFQGNFSILTNSNIEKLLNSKIINILERYYGLLVKGKILNIYLKNNKLISNSYNRLYITTFEIFMEFDEKLDESMFKLNRDTYIYANRNAYYINLKDIKFNEDNKSFIIKEINYFSAKNGLKLEDDLIVNIKSYYDEGDWYGHFAGWKEALYINNIQTDYTDSFYNLRNLNGYIAYYKPDDIRARAIPYKYEIINRKDLKGFIKNNVVENYSDFI